MTRGRLRGIVGLMKHVLIAIFAGLPAMASAIDGPRTPIADPLGSNMWDYTQVELLGDPAVISFDDRVKVTAPYHAEDSLAVPLLVDASAIDDVRRILVHVDYGPIPHILTFYPGEAEAKLALRFKIDQATAVRASVETSDGAWYVGSTYVDAAGGGCTQPAAAYASSDWDERLGEIHAQLWPSSGRLRAVIDHPMDTGLSGDIPVFIVEDMVLETDAGEELARLELLEPVNEDPAFTFFFAPEALPNVVALKARDNNGNRFEGIVTSGGTN